MAEDATCYRIRLRPQSPWLTPWHADTLFGCICWRYRELAGEEALALWLERFRAKDPPFVLSDAFPDGWLPEPMLAEFVADPEKKKRGPALIREEVFEAWRRSNTKLERPKDVPAQPRSARGLHVTLSRKTDTPLDPGGLFELDAAFTAAAAPACLSVFVRGTADVIQDVHACFELQAMRGFGKRSSSGFGAFSVQAPESCGLLDSFDGANGFIALSHFVPDEADPTHGAWGLKVKYPKLHGDLVEHPLKGRLVALTPGSAFRTGSELRTWYGRTFDISRDGYAALHYALCPAAPARLPAGGRI